MVAIVVEKPHALAVTERASETPGVGELLVAVEVPGDYALEADGGQAARVDYGPAIAQERLLRLAHVRAGERLV